MSSTLDHTGNNEFVQRVSLAAHGAAEVTPSDDDDLAWPSYRGLFIGGTGVVKVDMLDGSTVTFTGVPAGILPIVAKRVYETDTTATSIVALY